MPQKYKKILMPAGASYSRLPLLFCANMHLVVISSPFPQEAVREQPFSAISVPACRQTGQAKILILKIRWCIPAVKIFAFLDLAKNFSFPDRFIRHFSQYSSLITLMHTAKFIPLSVNKHHSFFENSSN